MVNINEDTKIYLYPNEISFRLGIQGLTTIIYENFHQKNFKDCLFIFFSKDKKALKIIEYDDNGVWMYVYRLNRARFNSAYIDVNQITNIDSRQIDIIVKSIKSINKKEKSTLKH